MRVWETSFRVSLAHEALVEDGPGTCQDGTKFGAGPAMTAPGSHFLRDLLVLLFAVTAGLTLSGIIANIYRLFARKPQSRGETALYYGIMVLAGASVLLENATRSYRKKDCSAPAYGFAIAIVGYWCFVLGIVVLSVALYV
jgi:hypothetical protein